MFSMTYSRTPFGLKRQIAAGLLTALCITANAASVKYEAVALGGTSWRYDYTLQGNATATAFDGLTIYFAASSFGQLSNELAPSGWETLVVQRDTGIPADGFLDLLNLGGSLSGALTPVVFSLRVEYLGTGLPRSQRYELYQSTPFSVVASGETVQVGAIPEPRTNALMLLGLGAVVALRKRSTSRSRQT